MNIACEREERRTGDEINIKYEGVISLLFYQQIIKPISTYSIQSWS